MREDFAAPNEQEFDHHTSVISRVVSLKPLPPTISLPVVVALVLACLGRPRRNVELQWSLDQDSLVDDSLRMLKRHLDIIQWSYEKAGDRLKSLQEIVPPEEVAECERALAEPDKLRQSIMDHFTRFHAHHAKRVPSE